MDLSQSDDAQRKNGTADIEVSPVLEVEGVTLQYKTKEHLVTAIYKVGFQV